MFFTTERGLGLAINYHNFCYGTYFIRFQCKREEETWDRIVRIRVELWKGDSWLHHDYQHLFYEHGKQFFLTAIHTHNQWDCLTHSATSICTLISEWTWRLIAAGKLNVKIVSYPERLKTLRLYKKKLTNKKKNNFKNTKKLKYTNSENWSKGKKFQVQVWKKGKKSLSLQ